MGELINGRTPEQIKRDLEQCSKVSGCAGCVHLGDRGCVEWNMANALSLIEHLEAAQPKWISVKDRLPEHEHEVLVYTDRYGGRTEFAYYVRHLEAWCQNCCPLIPNVTHWMPLPSVPKGE